MPSKRFRKRKYSKRRGLSKTMRKAVDKEIKKVERKEIEVKEAFFNSGASYTDINNVGVITGITAGPAQGTTQNTRIGDKIYIKEVRINWELRAPTFDGNGAHLIDVEAINRIIIFQWFPNTTWRIPLLTDILDTSATGSTNQWVLAVYNHDEASNYSILYDKTHLLTKFANNSNSTNSNSQKSIRIKLKKFKRHVMEFQPAADASHGSNQIWVLILNNSTTATGNNQCFQYNFAGSLLFIDP